MRILIKHYTIHMHNIIAAEKLLEKSMGYPYVGFEVFGLYTSKAQILFISLKRVVFLPLRLPFPSISLTASQYPSPLSVVLSLSLEMGWLSDPQREP